MLSRTALPWVDGVAFARRAIERAVVDRAAASRLRGWVFFDRGLIDAAAALQHLTGERVLDTLREAHSYHERVFITPPGWKYTPKTQSDVAGSMKPSWNTSA